MLAFTGTKKTPIERVLLLPIYLFFISLLPKMTNQPDITVIDKKEELRLEDVNKEELVIKAGTSDIEIAKDEAEEVFVNSFSEEETSRILRKIDYRLIPILSVLYLLAFIDRSNSEWTFPFLIEIPADFHVYQLLIFLLSLSPSAAQLHCTDLISSRKCENRGNER